MFKRVLVVLAIVFVLVAAAGVVPAQEKAREVEDRPMMRMMGHPDIAVWGGNIYVLEAGQLKKFGADLEFVKAVEVPHEGMEGPGMGAMKKGRMKDMHRRMMRGEERAQKTGRMRHHGRTMEKEADEEGDADEDEEGMMGMGPMMKEMPRGMRMRCRMMMRTRTHRSNPQCILSLEEELDLSEEQIAKLETIAETARAGTKQVLTEEQLEKMEEMEDTPRSMMEMCGKMRRHMRGMMGGEERMMPGMHGRMRAARASGKPMPMMGGRHARLAAGKRGVYVLTGSRLIAYDHDLEKVHAITLEREEESDE